MKKVGGETANYFLYFVYEFLFLFSSLFFLAALM